MSAEPKSSPTVSSDSVRWIAREAPPDSVVPLEQIVPLKPHPAEPEGAGGSRGRTKLIAIGVATVVLAAIAAILW